MLDGTSAVNKGPDHALGKLRTGIGVRKQRSGGDEVWLDERPTVRRKAKLRKTLADNGANLLGVVFGTVAQDDFGLGGNVHGISVARRLSFGKFCTFLLLRTLDEGVWV